MSAGFSIHTGKWFYIERFRSLRPAMFDKCWGSLNSRPSKLSVSAQLRVWLASCWGCTLWPMLHGRGSSFPYNWNQDKWLEDGCMDGCTDRWMHVNGLLLPRVRMCMRSNITWCCRNRSQVGGSGSACQMQAALPLQDRSIEPLCRVNVRASAVRYETGENSLDVSGDGGEESSSVKCHL